MDPGAALEKKKFLFCCGATIQLILDDGLGMNWHAKIRRNNCGIYLLAEKKKEGWNQYGGWAMYTHKITNQQWDHDLLLFLVLLLFTPIMNNISNGTNYHAFSITFIEWSRKPLLLVLLFDFFFFFFKLDYCKVGDYIFHVSTIYVACQTKTPQYVDKSFCDHVTLNIIHKFFCNLIKV